MLTDSADVLRQAEHLERTQAINDHLLNPLPQRRRVAAHGLIEVLLRFLLALPNLPAGDMSLGLLSADILHLVGDIA